MNNPKILLLDIETKPLEVFSFGIWEQNIGINQIKSDWCIFSYAAKWLNEKKMFYKDQRNSKNVSDDKNMLQGIWDLIDKADVIVTQNGKAFDEKKLNARFIINKMGQPSPYQHIDTKQLAKKKFSFTSNSLEYLCNALDTKHKKLKHGKFPGMELWVECIKGNKAAWKEMELYNKNDVLCLEDLYIALRPWGINVNLNSLHDQNIYKCYCGSDYLIKKGFCTLKSGRFQQYQCKVCGAWHVATGKKNNLFSKKKISTLKTPREK